MLNKEKSIRKHKKNIIKQMKELGTYNKNFDTIIDLTAQIMYDYSVSKEDFEKSGSKITVKYTNKNGATNIVKNPFYLAIEKLRDDSITYLRELGLTPQGLKKINIELGTEKKQESKLDSILESLD